MRLFAAIVATIGVIASVLVVQPALAVAPANSNYYSSYTLSGQTVGTNANLYSANTINTFTVAPAISNFSSNVSITFGTDKAKALASHALRIEWHQTFATGVTWNSQAQSGVTRSASVYGTSGLFLPNAYSEMNFQAASTDPSDPAGSSRVTVPSDASGSRPPVRTVW